MEISREYRPLFKTTVKGLAKVKLQGHTDLPREEVHQTIASYALREDDSFVDYKMLVFDDRIHFEKSQEGSSYPEIPYSSIVRLVVLPNFPDVCFIQFRRNAYSMYVVFRVRKVSYLPKLAKFVSTWNEANNSDTENTQSQSAHKFRKAKPEKKEYKYSEPQIVVQCSKQPLKSEENIPKPIKGSPMKSRPRSPSKPQPVEGPSLVESCELVCVKHDHKAVPPRQARKRSHSPPPQQRVRIRFRRRSHSEPSSLRHSEGKNYRPRFRSQPGTYTVILPTSKNVQPPKGFNRSSKQRRPQRRERIIIAKADSQSSSSSGLGERLIFKGDKVKTIYPSSLNLGRLSPRSYQNECLIHKLRKPINSN